METQLKESRLRDGNESERCQQLECVRDSEMRYRRLFEAAKDGILILDADSGAITDANPYIREILGYAPEDLIGKRLWEIGAFVDVKDNILVVVHRKHRVGQRADADLISDLPAFTGRDVAALFRFNREYALHCFIGYIFEKRHPSASRRHGSFRQAYSSIAEVVALLSLREAPQLENGECLLKVHCLARVYNIN